MKGFKGTTFDMTCQGFQYKVGQTYIEDGDIKMCVKGFHFCERLENVFSYYPRGESRYFEVEANGRIEKGHYKCVCSKLTIVRELSDAEVNRNVYGCGYGDGNCIDNGNRYGDGYGDGTLYGYGDDGFGGGYCDGFGDGFGGGYGDLYDYGGGYGYNYGGADGNRTDGDNDGNFQRLGLYAKEVNDEAG
jgi:hypothetical protein